MRWDFDSPRPEHVQQLKDLLKPAVSKTMLQLMFSEDFNDHMKALDILTDVRLPGWVPGVLLLLVCCVTAVLLVLVCCVTGVLMNWCAAALGVLMFLSLSLIPHSRCYF